MNMINNEWTNNQVNEQMVKLMNEHMNVGMNEWMNDEWTVHLQSTQSALLLCAVQ